MRHLLTFLMTAILALAAPVFAAAQAPGSILVRGTVTDEDGLPVPMAAVQIKGTTTGTVSDDKGAWSIRVPAGSILVVSSIGYTGQERRFTRDASWDVVLEEDAEMLQDAVVVGYGVQKKESVLGAISQVESTALVRSGQTNLTNALAGKLSGVLTYQGSGQPGRDDATILIRGLSSWNGSTPLVIVDGVERTFAELDPNEVKTISVLKDASATAVFGAKGANGVIIVTTKTGLKGRPKMNLTAHYGVSNPTELPQHIPSATVLEMAGVAYRNEQSWGTVIPASTIAQYRAGTDPVRYPDNDWFSLLLKDFAQTFDANFNVSGGSDRTRYFVSLGYANDGSIVRRLNDWDYTTFKYHKINYRSNLDFDLTKSTTLSARIGGSTHIVQAPDKVAVSTLFTYMYGASPAMFPAYYPASVLQQIPDWDYPEASELRLAQNFNSFMPNPYTLLSSGDFTQTTTNKLNTDFVLNQKLDFLTKGLSAKGLVSFTSTFSRISQHGEQSYPTYWLDYGKLALGLENPWSSTEKGTAVYVQPPYAVAQDNAATGTSVIFYWEASLNYARKFAGAHNVTALALFNQRQGISGVDFPRRSEALVGRVTYDYKGIYLFEANVGYTGSEQFSPKNRFGLFPSLAFGFVPSRYKAWKKAMPWWSTLKLRYSDGIVGSDASSATWLYYSSFSKTAGVIVEDQMANETARWETAHKRDLGIEMGWWKDALTLNVDLFDEQRRDMLVTPVESPLVGITSKDVNTGRMKKHGFEVELKYRQTLPGGFFYEIGGMLGMNENRVLHYEDAVSTPEYQKYAGKPYEAARQGMDRIDSGYYATIDEIHGYPNVLGTVQRLYTGTFKMLDYNTDGVLNTQDLHSIPGVAYAPGVGSLSLSLGYKGFSAHALLYGTRGKYITFNRYFWKEFLKQDLTVHVAQLDYWRPDNPDAAHPTVSMDDKTYSMLGGSSNDAYAMQIEGQSWRKSDYLTLKEASISYRFDNKQVGRVLGLSGLTVNLTGTNLFTLSDLIEGSPQRITLATSYYPIMRSVKLGVKMDF